MSFFTTPFPATDKLIYKARMIDRKLLSLNEERTFLIRLEFENPVPFTSGDSLAIYPHNHPNDVEPFCQALNLDPLRELSQDLTVFDFLQKRVALYKWNSKLSQFLFNEEKLPELYKDLEPVEILKRLSLSEEKALGVLERLSPQLPRYYSIASTPKQSHRHIDLLVTLSSFEHNGVLKWGLASSFLCKQAQISQEMLCFVHTAEHFRLPDDDKPLIMIGPGTGIAPFRAFIHERVHHGHHRNWLFFGERTQKYDFFFEEEWTEYASKGHLKLSLAFSRDQEDKIYVQDKLLEEAHHLKEWLEEGAILYVCGDAKKMARDVEETLIHLLSHWHQLDRKTAQLKLREWKKEGRYRLDVY